MSTIGILGGGQLARMLVLAGAPLGQQFIIVDNAENSCAGQVATLLKADYRDFSALETFAKRIDVATFDFENVPADTAHWLTEHTQVFPNPRALAVAQDRLEEKQLFARLGLNTPTFASVNNYDELLQAIDHIGFPAVLKTRRLGYDGKGQVRLRTPLDLDVAWAALGKAPLILEAWIEFEREVSLIAVRSRHGEFRTYPLIQNWHDGGILSASLAPAPASAALCEQAYRHARSIAEELDYVGVFALELFVVDGKLLGNEMAPRVHNSGHWTIEGAVCSQFENHIRAVLGLPLGDTSTSGINAMLNWVGELPPAEAVLCEPNAHWHDYGKTPRLGRKVGHATFCASQAQELSNRLQSISVALNRKTQIAPLLVALDSFDL